MPEIGGFRYLTTLVAENICARVVYPRCGVVDVVVAVAWWWPIPPVKTPIRSLSDGLICCPASFSNTVVSIE